MGLSKQEVRELLTEGWLRCLVTFEVAGKPQEHVEETLTKMLDSLESEKAINVITTERHAAVELEGEEGFFSSFAEVELMAQTLETLTSLAVNMTPASIEVLEPDSFAFPANKLQNWLNDVLSKLHVVSQELRSERQKARWHAQNTQNLIRNTIHILLASGDKKAADLARLSGVQEQELEPMLERWSEDGRISKEGELWTLKSSAK